MTTANISTPAESAHRKYTQTSIVTCGRLQSSQSPIAKSSFPLFSFNCSVSLQKVIEDFGYIYDSTVAVEPQLLPVWPYTLDYKIPHECKSGTCPTRQFPGVWEVPMNAHYIESYEGGHCPYLDQCVLHNHDADDVFEWLQEDFSRHYQQNKAPYMMAFKSNWFQIKELEKGLHKFLDWVTTLWVYLQQYCLLL